jgi:hypothetical protein
MLHQSLSNLKTANTKSSHNSHVLALHSTKSDLNKSYVVTHHQMLRRSIFLISILYMFQEDL